MKKIGIILSFLLFQTAFGSDFHVFEENGVYGIKNFSGEIVVPAIYEVLGWSNGEKIIIENVIGFKKNGRWGLINTKNKKIVNEKFYSLSPLKNQYLKASIKGKFNNLLFHGIVNTKGKTKVSFDYFHIDLLEDLLMVTKFDHQNFFCGLINFNSEVIIPIIYRKLVFKNPFLIAQHFDKKTDIFIQNNYKNPITKKIDSVIFNNGLIAYKNGNAGFINLKGQIIYNYQYKSIKITNNNIKAINFPLFKVYKKDQLIFEQPCDSLILQKNDFWIAYKNQTQYLFTPNFNAINSTNYFIQSSIGYNHIVIHSKNKKWSLIDHFGNPLIKNYDSIVHKKNYLFCLKKNSWHVYRIDGSKVNSSAYNQLLVTKNQNIIGKINEHWGIIGNDGTHKTSFIYDSVYQLAFSNSYATKYLGKWGIMRENSKWTINPAFEEIFELKKDLIAARKSRSYSFFQSSKYTFRTVLTPIRSFQHFTIVKNKKGHIGAINHYGRKIVPTVYTSHKKWSKNHAFMGRNFSYLTNNRGLPLLDKNEKISDVGSWKDGLLLIKKNNKCGFLDEQGRMRISNRYDEILPFSGRVAPFKLLGKWGVIDINEKIVIQPKYDKISIFYLNTAIVQSKRLFGIVHADGREVVKSQWYKIERLENGNYLVTTKHEKKGLINESGEFLLRPNYDNIQDINNRVIVTKGEKMGMLSYKGSELLKCEYKNIQFQNNFLVICKN